MFDIIRKLIEKRDYELRDILYKINKMYIQNYLTEEQKEELDNLARENAKAENSYAPLQKQIDALAARVAVLENGNKTENTDTIEEYPEYVQPLGSQDAYNIGDKVTYNGVKYECLIDNCVWTPVDFPQGWKEVK
jgi:hypothetical protein